MSARTRERERVRCVLHATSCFTLKYPNGHRKSSKCASASWISNLIRLFDSHAHIRRQAGRHTRTLLLCCVVLSLPCESEVRWVLEQHYSCLLSPQSAIAVRSAPLSTVTVRFARLPPIAAPSHSLLLLIRAGLQRQENRKRHHAANSGGCSASCSARCTVVFGARFWSYTK